MKGQKTTLQGVSEFVGMYLAFFLALNAFLGWLLSVVSDCPFWDCYWALVLSMMGTV